MHAPDMLITLSDGRSVRLTDLAAEKPLVLVFLRHFGCIFCRENVAQLRLHPTLNVVFVAMGSAEQTERFRQSMRSPHLFIADPELKLYEAFGLGKGTGRQLLNPKVFARGFGATLRGHWVGLPIGDPWQMPGMFKIEIDGTVSWEYRSLDAADNAPVAEIERRLAG